jgi:hypothetical protein
VKLVTRDTIIAYGEGSRHLHAILAALALIETADGDERELPLGRNVFEGGAGILVTATGEIATARSARDDSPFIGADRTRTGLS